MKLIIADSCSMILLAKTTLLKILAGIVNLIIPEYVYNEAVVTGLKKEYSDSIIINYLVDQKKIKIKNVKKGKIKFKGLGKGEEEAILLFKQLKGDLLLTDDKKAITVCKYLAIPFTISPKIIISLFKSNKITREKAFESLEILRIEGRYSQFILEEAINSLEVK